MYKVYLNNIHKIHIEINIKENIQQSRNKLYDIEGLCYYGGVSF